LAHQFQCFLAEAHRLKHEYSSRITLLVGLETEYITPLDLNQLGNLLESYKGQIQYLVGSVHHVHGIPIDLNPETYQKALHHVEYDTDHLTQENFLCSYFDAQMEAMTRFLPEVIGHFDLCRLWNPGLKFCDFPKAWDLMVRNIAFAINYGALFELNAAAFRKGWSSAYPGEDVVKVSAL
jgi:histidinol-phosphatase (PHP family)